MNICMVLDSYFPPDIRVEKEARALLKAGHKVVVLSLKRKGRAWVENVDGIEVVRISYPKGFPGMVLKHRFYRTFIDPYWEKAIADVTRYYKIEAIHVHDLPLVKTGLSVAKRFRIPVIADLHENFPEALRVWRKEERFPAELSINQWRKYLKKVTARLLAPIGRWRKLEVAVLRKVNKVIAVVDEARIHYIKYCKLPLDKVMVIMNSVDLSLFNEQKVNTSVVAKYSKNFVITYVGGFSPHRGLDVAIRSMTKVLKEIPNAKLLLVGGKGHKWYEEMLRRLCRKLKIENSVEFTGWVKLNDIPSYIAASDVCLIPHYKSDHTDTTIPHKLFQYMAMGKPVIATNCRPLKRIISECKCGVIIPSGDHERMASAIITLYNDKEYARRLGENGKEAVIRRYNWEIEAKKLRKLYEELEYQHR